MYTTHIDTLAELSQSRYAELLHEAETVRLLRAEQNVAAQANEPAGRTLVQNAGQLLARLAATPGRIRGALAQ
jgi:hypothetical protein